MNKMISSYFKFFSLIIFALSTDFIISSQSITTERLLAKLEENFSIKTEDLSVYSTTFNHQRNTVVHLLLIRIIENMNQKRNPRVTDERQDDLSSRIRDDLGLLNKLSRHFASFKDIQNYSGQKPFDIIWAENRNMNLAGSIRNFKNLLPEEHPQSSGKLSKEELGKSSKNTKVELPQFPMSRNQYNVDLE